ncbi:hypothetical protein HU200_012566 [Digitaria exilis]|uniref:Uncharacterized protein n=1 Tax=Digitaria exilis TaxID=1010633 RepID=A0A835KN14_9POAL|nr:hypothetical protein HU200_012566 [Digitaria exilis]
MKLCLKTTGKKLTPRNIWNWFTWKKFALFSIEKFDCNRENLEKFPDEDHKPDANMFAENATIEETIPFDSKGKQNVNTSLKKLKSNKKTYIGWGSKELIEFLSSIGMDTSKALDESEIVGVIMRYIKLEDLIKNNKKKTSSCDGKLYSLFGRRKVSCKSVRKFLAVHLAANSISKDENFYGSENDDVPIMKNKAQNILELKIAKRVSERNKSCYASLSENNIKLIYLRRSLVINLLNHLDTFDQEVVGCFVRVKNAPSVRCYEIPKRPYQLGLVTDTKKSSEEYKINGKSTNILLCVTGFWEDVRISMLSEEAFEEVLFP